MRLLFIDFRLPYLLKDASYHIGGWTVQLKNWIDGLQATGHHVGVLTWRGANDYTHNDFSQILIETYDPGKGIPVVKYLYSYIPSLLRSARKYKPDILIQATSGLHTGILAFVADKLGVPFVHRVSNDDDTDERIRSKITKYQLMAYRYGVARADLVLCQNRYQYDQVRQRYPQKNVAIISNPFDTTQPLPTIVPRKERKYIAWLGVFKRAKNMPLLLHVARELPEMEFMIAGTPHNRLNKETANAIEALKLLENVTFTGYLKREEILYFLAGSLALLSTSHHEGFSNTFLESLAAGTPVIAPSRVDPDQFISQNRLGMTTSNDKDLPGLIEKMSGNDRQKDACHQRSLPAAPPR